MNRRSFLFTISAMAAAVAVSGTAFATVPPPNKLTGVVVSVLGNLMVLQTRTGKNVTVDLTEARASQHVGVIAPKVAVVVYGSYLADGTFRCLYTGHASPTSRSWDPDR